MTQNLGFGLGGAVSDMNHGSLSLSGLTRPGAEHDYNGLGSMHTIAIGVMLLVMGAWAESRGHHQGSHGSQVECLGSRRHPGSRSGV